MIDVTDEGMGFNSQIRKESGGLNDKNKTELDKEEE